MIKRIYIYLYLIRGFEQKTEYKVLYRYKDVAKKFVIKTNVVANFYDAAEILDIIYKEIKYDCDIVFLTNDFFIENYVKKKIGEEKKENFFRNIIEIKSFIEEKKIFDALEKETYVQAIIRLNKKKNIYKKNIRNTQNAYEHKKIDNKKPIDIDNLSPEEKRKIFEERAVNYPTEMRFRENINKKRRR